MIAKRLQNFDSSLFRHAFELAGEMVDPIDLSIGFPEDDTPDYIKAAGIKAITDDFTRYTASNGIFELRVSVAEKLGRENNIQVTPDQVTITPGLTTGILLVYMSILDPGDEILIPDPCFPPYTEVARSLGAVPVAVDTYPDFQLTADAIEPLITHKTKALIINSPNNPTGAIYPEAELRKIARLAKAHNLVIISDEIYEYFAYDVEHFSIGSIYPNTLTLNGFSKAYAMTGWRVGYIAGSTELIGAINSLQQYIVFSSSSISQRAAVAALKHSATRLTEKYQKKRDMVVKELSTDFDIQGAQGAFYTYLPLPPDVSDMEFCEIAARKGVIVLPSRAYSKRTDYVRIAFATDHQTLRRGINIIKTMMTSYKSTLLQ